MHVFKTKLKTTAYFRHVGVQAFNLVETTFIQFIHGFFKVGLFCESLEIKLVLDYKAVV